MIAVNLIGTFNLATQAAARMAAAPPLNADGERGVVVTTASVAAFEGQIGQLAYAASKGAVAAMTLPMARDLAKSGIRVVSIAPGLFLTPMLEGLPQEAQASLGGQVPFPARLGSPDEYAALVVQIAENADAERLGDPPRRRDPHGAALTGPELASALMPSASSDLLRYREYLRARRWMEQRSASSVADRLTTSA